MVLYKKKLLQPSVPQRNYWKVLNCVVCRVWRILHESVRNNIWAKVSKHLRQSSTERRSECKILCLITSQTCLTRLLNIIRYVFFVGSFLILQSNLSKTTLTLGWTTVLSKVCLALQQLFLPPVAYLKLSTYLLRSSVLFALGHTCFVKRRCVRCIHGSCLPKYVQTT